MNPENTIKINQLEDWLKNNPFDHPLRQDIETDLRKLKEVQDERPIERDTFDLYEHKFYDI
jgi:hypothetical protein